MKKKILAVALAATMVVASAFNAFAATLDDLTVSGWWGAQTEGIAIEEGTTTITFHNVSTNAADNWENYVYILYTADGAYAGSATDGDITTASGYSEIWVGRADNFGWQGANNTASETLTDDTGISFTADSAPEDWATWLAEMGEGVDCTITVTLSGSTITVKSEASDAVNTTVFPIDSSVTYYIALSGQDCVLSNITVSTPSESGSTGSGTDDSNAGTDDSNAGSDDSSNTTDDSSSTTDNSSNTTTDDSSSSNSGTSTTTETNTETGDVATFATVAVVLAAAVAIVALRKRVTE